MCDPGRDKSCVELHDKNILCERGSTRNICLYSKATKFRKIESPLLWLFKIWRQIWPSTINLVYHPVVSTLEILFLRWIRGHKLLVFTLPKAFRTNTRELIYSIFRPCAMKALRAGKTIGCNSTILSIRQGWTLTKDGRNAKYFFFFFFFRNTK